MASIYWLASYPKSGNTWMRIFLTNYQRDSECPADINELEGGPIASSRAWFDEWAGIEASALDDRLIAHVRPDVYRCMARAEAKPLFMKVHDSWSLTDRGDGLFPADVTEGVIYIIRNPLDMAASCSNHWGVDIEKAVANLCDPDYALARSLGGLSDQLRQDMGTWSNHVVSWVYSAGLPVLTVRYEDLRRDALNTFGKVVRFCNFDYDEKRLRKAIDFSDFAELKKQEKERGFRESSLVAPEAFFRKGKAGGWRDELSEELVGRIIEVNGETMRRFGYLDDYYQPI